MSQVPLLTAMPVSDTLVQLEPALSDVLMSVPPKPLA